MYGNFGVILLLCDIVLHRNYVKIIIKQSEIDVDITLEGVMAYDAKILSNPVGDEMYFSSSSMEASHPETISVVTYMVNLNKADSKRLNMYLVQYSSDVELVVLTPKEIIISAGEALTLKTDTVEMIDGTAKFKAFI